MLKEANTHARAVLAQALDLDPDNARGHMLLGTVNLVDFTMGWSEEPGVSLDRALHHGKRYVQLDDLDGQAHAHLGETLPNHNRLEEAIGQLTLAARLDPFELSWIPWFRGEAFYLTHRYEEAIASLLRVNEPINDVRRWLAASYAQTDRKEQAGEMLKQYLRVAEAEMPFFPGWAFDTWEPIWSKEYSYQPYSRHLCEGLEKAWSCLPTSS